MLVTLSHILHSARLTSVFEFFYLGDEGVEFEERTFGAVLHGVPLESANEVFVAH